MINFLSLKRLRSRECIDSSSVQLYSFRHEDSNFDTFGDQSIGLEK